LATIRRFHRVARVTAACRDGLIRGRFEPIRVWFGLWIS
jgi:hypothetical protein